MKTKIFSNNNFLKIKKIYNFKKNKIFKLFLIKIKASKLKKILHKFLVIKKKFPKPIKNKF